MLIFAEERVFIGAATPDQIESRLAQSRSRLRDKVVSMFAAPFSTLAPGLHSMRIVEESVQDQLHAGMRLRTFLFIDEADDAK